MKRTKTASRPGMAVPLIPRRVLHGNPERTNVQLSPDGRRLGFVAPVNGVLNVWVGPANRPDAARPITKDTHRGIWGYWFAHTGRHVLYVQDRDGDENTHVYRVDLGTRRVRDLTPMKGVQVRVQAVSHKFPNEILIGVNRRDARFHDVYRLHIATGRMALVRKNDGYAGFVTDDDYRVRFAVRFSPDGAAEYLQPSGKTWTPFLRFGPEDALTSHIIGFNGDNSVLYLSDSRGRNTSALAAMDLRSGDYAVLAEDPRVDAGGVLMHPRDRTVQAVSFTYDRTRWQFFDDRVKRDFDILTKVAVGDVWVASRTLNDERWIVVFSSDRHPHRYYLYDRRTRRARFLFTDRPELEGFPLMPLQPVVIRSRDGLDLMCYLTLPPGVSRGSPEPVEGAKPGAAGGRALRPAKPLPMVLMVHGGPWGRDGWGLSPHHQWLANRGYAVLSVNFRGSTGFGKAFVNAADLEWGGRMHDDLIDAVKWAVRGKIARPDRIAIYGGSYGGYAVLVGLTRTPRVFACGVDLVGPSSLVTLLRNAPPYWTAMKSIFMQRVGDVDTKKGRAFLDSRSPLTHARKICRPLLIGQGGNDPRVKRGESDQIVKAMRDAGIPVTYVLFPDEGHGFARPQNRLLFDAVSEAFLARHLGGRCEPAGDELLNSSLVASYPDAR